MLALSRRRPRIGGRNTGGGVVYTRASHRTMAWVPVRASTVATAVALSLMQMALAGTTGGANTTAAANSTWGQLPHTLNGSLSGGYTYQPYTPGASVRRYHQHGRNPCSG